MVVASQLTPLHWGRVEPGQIWNEHNEYKMGRVWFTISVCAYEERRVPSKLGTAGRLALITAAAALPVGGLLAFFIVGTASAVTSVTDVKRNGIYANGKTLVVGGLLRPDNVYVLTWGVRNRHASDPIARSLVSSYWNIR